MVLILFLGFTLPNKLRASESTVLANKLGKIIDQWPRGTPRELIKCKPKCGS